MRAGRSACGGSIIGLLIGLAGCPAPPAVPGSIGLEPVAAGLTAPLALVTASDGSGRLFVVDQIGVIRIIDADGMLRDTPFLDLRDRMVAIGIDFGGGLVFDERGLLGLAFHPGYAANGRLFVVYNAPLGAAQPEGFDSDLRLAEFHVSADSPDRADPESEAILLTVAKPQFNHNGGQVAFGPDGYLYLSIGDGGNANDEGLGHTPGTGNAQNRATLLGKLIRIDVDGAAPYAIPADNPFVGDNGARAEIWAYGLRNAWRFSFDAPPGGAARLFAADVGQDLFEEINLIERGGNYGWRIREGDACFDPQNASDPPADCPATGPSGSPLLDPIIAYPHVDGDGAPLGLAAIGGFVYRGNRIPGLVGAYVFGDWSATFGPGDGTIFAATEDSSGRWTRNTLAIAAAADGRIGRFILGFGRDDDGELYVLSSANVGPFGTTGQVDRIVPAE